MPAPDSSAQSSTIGGSTCLDQPWTVANVPDSSECGDRLLGASRKRSQRPPRRVPRRPTRGATASATYPRSQRARMNQSYPLDHTEHLMTAWLVHMVQVFSPDNAARFVAAVRPQGQRCSSWTGHAAAVQPRDELPRTCARDWRNEISDDIAARSSLIATSARTWLIATCPSCLLLPPAVPPPIVTAVVPARAPPSRLASNSRETRAPDTG